MGKIFKAIALALILSIFSPPSLAQADDPNPSTSEIDNYGNLALSLSAKQGFAVVGSTILNSSRTNFSVEAWLNPSESLTASYGQIFLKQDSISFSLNSLKLEARLNNGTWATYSSSASLRTNEWQHVALTKSGTTLTFYINGAVVYQNASAPSQISSNTKYVGVGGDGWNGSSTLTSPQTSLFAGGIDEVRVWAAARTQSEIQSNKDVKLSGSTSNLHAYWDFNGNGSTSWLYDRTSNGYNLNIYGSPTFPDIKSSVTTTGATTITFPRTYLNAVGGFRIPSDISSVSVLVVGGGGGGGFDGGGGGGGGGVYQNSNIEVTPGTAYPIQVGGGGPAVNGYSGGTFCSGTWSGSVVACQAATGNTSRFNTYTASGGGGGGGIENSGLADSDSGALVRGGGGGAGGHNTRAGSNAPGAGAFSGGSSTSVSNNAGGGGGSSTAAGSSTTSTVAGNGAAGVTALINSVVYGSGGAGGSFSSATLATGGANAGNGGTNGVAPTKPVANRGGGGSGGGNGSPTATNAYGTSGAAGVVIIRYALTGTATLSFSSSPIYRTSTAITASTNVAGRVTFFANNKRIPGCIKVLAVSLVATCNWKPSVKSNITISAQIYPTDSNYISASVISRTVTPSKRTVVR